MSTQSKNVIRFYAGVRKENEAYIFFHFYNGRTLRDLMFFNPNMDEKFVAQIAKQLLKGLMELHENKFIHRDLKPANILLHFECMPSDKHVSREYLTNFNFKKNNCFSVVIADLGLGREMAFEMSVQGTPLYKAPEVK
uniref:Protein kinase domain-containing protein n=1 Tax=Euplotes harpa TaxID=151035 RepID=A0A7S3JMC7_9SPIT|mmetsp:Transcript_4482/g.5410  ORF Transcript_4482/g.5410 Transcript_4482/m.5410 type:complete len:138 (+) Transcript_4482:248-661(+)